MKHALVKICGIVQGVGFRPFIHRHAEKYGIKGYIKNTSSGVELELEGDEDAIESFIGSLPDEAPSLAFIESLDYLLSDTLAGYSNFEIRRSKTEAARNTLISPDISICPDCLRELGTPGDRRYRYPFINCTNCGPRFTIIKDVPYDRAKTSMGGFTMCPRCESEYTDIRDRRYHAQPDCCPDCGPQLFFLDAEGRETEGDALENARQLLKNGGIAAIKGLGGMHLACRTDNPEIARTLRRRKQRDEKPFAIMCRSIECARELCELSTDEERLLTGSRRPIVLLNKKSGALSQLSENGYLGIMLPYTPLHYLLMGDDIDSLVMTSANLSDTPIMYRNDEAVEKLRGIADGFLLHNRDIVIRCDDSLCYALDGREYFLRRSRGYVPFPIRLDGMHDGAALGCGAEQKASFCLLKDSYAFSSQHIGDLKNLETLENYAQQIAHFENLFDIKPEIIASDLHPDYMSTLQAEKLSRERGIPLVRVQHHYAHMLSCMADNNLRGRTIGLVWDGTGLGTDGSIWGGECLCGDERGFERFGTIRKIRLPGGDRVTKELFRTAFSLLRDAGCSTEGIQNSAAIEMQLKSGINCPQASSMGRLFDGAAAILGIKTLAGYEGQGAVLLEAEAGKADTQERYTVEFEESFVFDWRPMIREMCGDISSGVEPPVCAAKFINTLIEVGARQAKAASEKYGTENVVLSGGTFQNMYIMRRLPERLRSMGLKAWTHKRVSCNDEGISLGQILHAQAVKKDVFGSTAETD